MTEFKNWREKYLWLQERGVRFQFFCNGNWVNGDPWDFNGPAEELYRIHPEEKP